MKRKEASPKDEDDDKGVEEGAREEKRALVLGWFGIERDEDEEVKVESFGIAFMSAPL